MRPTYKLFHGDCLELMKLIPDASVDLVLCDPPYGTIKGAKFYQYASGCQWDQTLDFTKMWEELNRITRPMANILLFGQEPYTSALVTSVFRNISFSYRNIWLKDSFANPLTAKKACVNYYEDIMLFSRNRHDVAGLNPLRSYFKEVLNFIGLSLDAVNKKLGHRKADHALRFATSQFAIPTETTYNQLINEFKIDRMDGYLRYNELKKIDKEFQPKRVFNLGDGKKHKSNVFHYKKDYDGFHPTQKPVALLQDLINTYSNVGETVLDFTMGSGSTGVAAYTTDRNFIGMERDKVFFDIAVDRLERVKAQ